MWFRWTVRGARQRGAVVSMRVWQLAVCVVAVALWAAACGDSGGEGNGGGADGSTAEPDTIDPPRELDGWSSLGGDERSTFHNPGDQGVSVDNVGSLTLAYKVDTLGGVTGTPVFADGVVYTSSQGRIVAADVETGDIKWENSDWGSFSSLGYADGVIYVHASSGSGGSYLAALDADDGVEQWNRQTYDHPNSVPYSSPTIAGDLVIVGASGSTEFQRDQAIVSAFKGNVSAYDRTTGDEKWRFYTVDPDSDFNGATVWSSVSAHVGEGLVFVSTGNNFVGEDSGTSDSLFALELETGKKVWQTQAEAGDVWSFLQPGAPDNDFGTNPIVFDFEIDGEVRKLVALGQKSGSFWAFDRETGDVVWESKLGPASQLIGGVLNNGAFDGEHLYAACNDQGARKSRLVAMDPASGDVVWERELQGWVWGPITVSNGVGFVPVSTTMTAFDVKDGAELLSFQAEGTIATGAVVFDGHVFFGNGTQYTQTTVASDMNVLALP
jgi:polyvinyl alcohol dehydrogenase (cytochrome)